jgi:hypothetical protein
VIVDFLRETSRVSFASTFFDEAFVSFPVEASCKFDFVTQRTGYETCLNCGQRESDDLLVACPRCGLAYEQGTSPVPSHSLDFEGRVLRKLTLRVATFIFGGFSLMTVIGVVMLIWQFRGFGTKGSHVWNGHLMAVSLRNSKMSGFVKP